MVLYSFSIFDRHCSFLLISGLTSGESVYHRQWNIPPNQTKVPSFNSPGPPVPTHTDYHRLVPTTNKHEDDAKLLFGVVYSLRNMTRKLSSPCGPVWFLVNSVETTISYRIVLQSINSTTTKRQRH